MWGKDGYDMMAPVPMRAPARSPAPVPDRPAAASVPFGNEVDLVPPRGLRSGRVIAVLVALGGIAGALITWFAFTFLEAIFSIWGSSQRSSFPLISAIVVFVVSQAIAAFLWTQKDLLVSKVTVNSDHLIVTLPEWRHPLMVPRSQVRLVAIDDRPLEPFRKNPRFPIDGMLPAEVFADALDRSANNPWEPAPPVVPIDPVSAPPVSAQPVSVAPAAPSFGPAADPAETDAGWATVGSRVPAPPPGRAGYLYSGDGSALPLFVYNEMDLPNVALLFTGDLALPSRSTKFGMMGYKRSIRSSNARRARGMMVRARNEVQARQVFGAWGIVRNPHADEVLGAGLRPPKPLMGWRAAAYVAMFCAPLVIRAITKLL